MGTQRLEILLGYLKTDPEDAFTLYSIGYEYAKADQQEDAIRYFEELKRLHPDYVGLYYHLGKALEQVEKKDEAERVYREGMMQARKAGEPHSLSELQGALNRILGLDFEDEV